MTEPQRESSRRSRVRENACSRGIAALGCVRLVGRIFWRSLAQRVQRFSHSPSTTSWSPSLPEGGLGVWLALGGLGLQRGYNSFRWLLPCFVREQCLSWRAILTQNTPPSQREALGGVACFWLVWLAERGQNFSFFILITFGFVYVIQKNCSFFVQMKN